MWAQAYCGHNWVVQWAVFMRLCGVQSGGEKNQTWQISLIFMQADPEWKIPKDAEEWFIQSKITSALTSLVCTQALSGPPTESLGMRLALTIIPCPGVYSLTRTWLGSLSSKTPREAILLPQTPNHCTWKRHHYDHGGIHAHLTIYWRLTCGSCSPTIPWACQKVKVHVFKHQIQPAKPTYTFGWGIPPEK